MKRVTVLLLLLFFSSHLFSQEAEDIKIGLVLSGGGAKGLAHIGALEVFEEAGIRIDYIGGTSMGAIVGALYASGYSAKELDSIFKSIDFSTLIQDNIPRNTKTFYEKSDAEKYAISLPFDDFKISLPSSLSKGQNIYNLLSRLTSHVAHINDFSQLPIPFFCIGTDIETGKPIKLDKGYLPQAIRASGALPSLFSAVEIDGQLLIDGGVTNNYPIEHLKKTDVDIIIGVDVQDSLLSRENLISVFDILTQINNYRTINDMTEKRGQTDVYINPDISNFSVISFDKGNAIIQAGKDKAYEFRHVLDSLAQRQSKSKKENIIKNMTDSLNIDLISIAKTENYTRSYVLGKLKLKPPYKTTYHKLNEGINNLSATGNFSQINYFLKKNEEEEDVLQIQLTETKTKTFLRLGIHHDNLYKSAALINITRKRLLRKNDVVSFDFVLGDNLRYNFDYYIDKGYYWSFGLHSSYNKFKKNVNFTLFPSMITEQYGNVSKIELKHEVITNQIYVQTVFQQIYSVGVGAEHKHLKFKSATLQEADRSEDVIFEDTNYFSAYGYLKLDDRDNKYFPKNGLYFDGVFNFYAFTTGLYKNLDQFSIAKGTLGYSFSPINKLAVNITSEAGLRIGRNRIGSLDFFVGGYGYNPVNNFVHLFGYDAASIRGDTYFKASLRMDYEILKKTYISGVYNAANVGDRLFDTGGWINNKPYTGYAIGVSSESYIGPLEFFYSRSPEFKEDYWYVSIGFWF